MNPPPSQCIQHMRNCSDSCPCIGRKEGRLVGWLEGAHSKENWSLPKRKCVELLLKCIMEWNAPTPKYATCKKSLGLFPLHQSPRFIELSILSKLCQVVHSRPWEGTIIHECTSTPYRFVTDLKWPNLWFLKLIPVWNLLKTLKKATSGMQIIYRLLWWMNERCARMW